MRTLTLDQNPNGNTVDGLSLDEADAILAKYGYVEAEVSVLA
jgi:hypothetical protein